jgi:hypothetical protein
MTIIAYFICNVWQLSYFFWLHRRKRRKKLQRGLLPSKLYTPSIIKEWPHEVNRRIRNINQSRIKTSTQFSQHIRTHISFMKSMWKSHLTSQSLANSFWIQRISFAMWCYVVTPALLSNISFLIYVFYYIFKIYFLLFI